MSERERDLHVKRVGLGVRGEGRSAVAHLVRWGVASATSHRPTAIERRCCRIERYQLMKEGAIV